MDQLLGEGDPYVPNDTRISVRILFVYTIYYVL